MLVRVLIIHSLVPFIGLVYPYIMIPLKNSGVIQVSEEAQLILELTLYASTVVNNMSTLYFIKPYRRWIKSKLAIKKFRCTPQVHSST